jgi:hypothetical protein
MSEDASGDPIGALVARHTRFGWWALLAFLSLGLVLEALHGFKIGWYLDVSNETRRLMFTLAHTHGTLLGILNLVFALSLKSGLIGGEVGRLKLASTCLVWGAILMPIGFALGGITIYGGDPGIPIVISPIGALLVLASVGLTALSTRQQ